MMWLRKYIGIWWYDATGTVGSRMHIESTSCWRCHATGLLDDPIDHKDRLSPFVVAIRMV